MSKESVKKLVQQVEDCVDHLATQMKFDNHPQLPALREALYAEASEIIGKKLNRKLATRLAGKLMAAGQREWRQAQKAALKADEIGLPPATQTVAPGTQAN
jgi:hypothetical protein